ncbi:MAG: WXG100 family type VII secretion target [Anaerolineales bacterium]|nr:WXG100 family type VII secretion target [Anaerolineales bacterium]
MTTLHMDTEQVREIARQLDRAALDMLTQQQNLQASGSRLSLAWTGGGASDYLDDLQAWLRAFQNQVHELGTLARRVGWEAEEWEQVDSQRPFGRWHDLRTGWGTLGGGLGYLDDANTGLATALVIGGLAGGSAYAGQVKLFGARGMKSQAGLAGSLTSIKAQNLPGHMLKNSHPGPLQYGLAALELADRGVENFAQYSQGTDRAAATAIDVAFVAGKIIASPYVQYAAATVAIGAVTALGAPAVVVAGAGLAAWYGGGLAFNWLADTGYELLQRSGARDAMVRGGGAALEWVGDQASNAFSGICKGISSLF